jgi:steroid delta-isomerase-like uncharacterized protein
MAEPDVIRTVLRFVNEINRHDVAAMLSLVSDDHVFVDGTGHETRGKERLRDVWTRYFTSCPDYRIQVEHPLQAGIIVALFGTASGTLRAEGVPTPTRRWTNPSAWKAVVRDDRVERWQVFTNPEPTPGPPNRTDGAL